MIEHLRDRGGTHRRQRHRKTTCNIVGLFCPFVTRQFRAGVSPEIKILPRYNFCEERKFGRALAYRLSQNNFVKELSYFLTRRSVLAARRPAPGTGDYALHHGSDSISGILPAA